MSQVMIVSDDKELNKILQFLLSQKYGVDCIVKADGNEAVSMLSILPVDVILSKEMIGKEFTAARICEFLKNHNNPDKAIQLVVLGKSPFYKHGHSVPTNATNEKIVTQIGFALGLEKEQVNFDEEKSEPEERSEDATTVFRLPPKALSIQDAIDAELERAKKTLDFVPFHIIYLQHVPVDEKLDFDIYTRIKKQSEWEYNKKLSAGEKLTQALVDKLMMRTSRDIYIKKDDQKKCSDFFNGFVIERLRKLQAGSFERFHMNADVYEILMESFRTSTFDKNSVELIKEMVKSIDSMMKFPDPILHFKNFLAVQKTTYSYMHAHLTCLLIFQIVDLFPWGKDQSKNKIIYLSLFHDLCLGTDRLIKLHHRWHTDHSHFSEEDKSIMMNHADASAKILESIVKAPKELTSLVREHHGMKSGKGFNEANSLSVTPLTMAFMVAEDVTTRYLELFEKIDRTHQREPDKAQVSALFAELKEKYDRHTYADVIEEFHQLLLPQG